jgi:hypothetical protein
MELPAMLQGDSLKRLVQGAVVGAAATMIVGFNWGGWMLGGSARTLADTTARSAVVAAVAPICVDQFQRSSDAAAHLVELKKVSTWERATFVEKGGWAVMPGSKSPDSGVAQACASLLDGLK